MLAGLVQTGRHDFSATFDSVDTRKSLFRKNLYVWLREALVLNSSDSPKNTDLKSARSENSSAYVRQGTASPSDLQGTTAVRPAPLSDLGYTESKTPTPERNGLCGGLSDSS